MLMLSRKRTNYALYILIHIVDITERKETDCTNTYCVIILKLVPFDLCNIQS